MNGKSGQKRCDQGERVFQRKLLVGLVVLACLTPLGIVLPRVLGSAEAWGEWGPGYLRTMLGYLPEGLRKTMDIWHAPASNYTLPWAGGSLISRLLSYGISGVAGLLIILLVVRLLMRTIKGHEG